MRSRSWSAAWTGSWAPAGIATPRIAIELAAPRSPVALHTVFEALAYAVGFRTFLWTRRRLAPTAFRHDDHVVWLAIGAIVGAAVGAKLSFWLDDPLTAFADFPAFAICWRAS